MAAATSPYVYPGQAVSLFSAVAVAYGAPYRAEVSTAYSAFSTTALCPLILGRRRAAFQIAQRTPPTPPTPPPG